MNARVSGIFPLTRYVVLAVVAVISAWAAFCVCSWASPVQQEHPAEKSTIYEHSKGKRNMTIVDPIVQMDTAKGTIKIQVFAGKAPKTAANFIDLVNKGFYNGLTFHRYEPGFCVQGGDPRGNGQGGYVDPNTHRERTIPLEVTPELKHDQAGIVAMARSNDPIRQARSSISPLVRLTFWI